MRQLGALVMVAGLLIAGCDPEPGEAAPTTAPQPEVVDEAMPYAYARDGELRVVRGGDTVAEVELNRDETVVDTEWTLVGDRLAVLTSSRLLSVDTGSGDVATADCSCSDVAVADGRFYTLAAYGAPELVAYDAATLRAAGQVRPDGVGERGMMLAAGAGDRLVVFAITADGARPFTDVLVVDPATSATRRVGKTDALGSPARVAYTPRGWLGRPVVAYTVNASSGSDSSEGALVWFDPAEGDQQVVDDSAMRAWTGAGANDNTTFEGLWWGRDGTPHLSARVWKADFTDVAAPAPWRHDGTTWLRASDPPSDEDAPAASQVRDLGDGVRLTLADGELRSGKGTIDRKVADDVVALSTPPITGAAAGVAATVVNLNAAMGYHLKSGDPLGTDATAADLADLADDILRQNGDVAALQEMARPAADHVARILAERTGQRWELTWSTSDPDVNYYAGEEPGEGPAPGYGDVPSGNALLVRLGHGVQAQSRRTGPDGVELESLGRSFCGVDVTTADGRTIAVYVTHLARTKDAPEAKRVRDIRQLQEHLSAITIPTVLTGDFNESVDLVDGGPTEPTVRALRDFTERGGFTDPARDLGPTSNQRGLAAKVEGHLRIDYVLVRGTGARDAVRFVSHQSDHWGLAATLA